MSHTEDRLEAIPVIALEVHNELRAKHEQRAEERAQAELARGCEQCGKPWKGHYRRGEYVGCR